MKEFPQIFAFYSFKGGVGRSMAVLNLAYALAAAGRHILVLDMDLEAPGLSGFLHREEEISSFARFDVVDLVGWAGSASLPLDPFSFPPMSDYVVSIPPEKLESIPRFANELGRLDIIPAEEDRNYYDRLARLAMGSLDQDSLVRIGSILRAWLKSLRFPIDVPDYYGPDCERIASYDYVLVDSRTGITETGGLCIGPLSDQLVVLSALNYQNVKGTRSFLEEVGVLKNSSPAGDELELKPCLIVASLVPTGEIETKRERLNQLEEALGKIQVKLSYHPQLALRETIFTRDCLDEYLAREYDELMQQLLRMGDDGDDPSLLEAISWMPSSSTEFFHALRRLLRLGTIRSVTALLGQLLSNATFAEVRTDADYILWDRVCRALSGEESTSRVDVFEKWATLLLYWGQRSTDPQLSALRFEVARINCEQILRSKEASSVQRSQALLTRGMTYHSGDKLDDAITAYTAVINVPDAPAGQKAIALANRGMTHGQLGDPEKAIDDYTAAIQLAEAKQKSQGSIYHTFTGSSDHPVTHTLLGDSVVMSTTFTSLFQSPDPFANVKAHSLVNRGETYHQKGEPQKAIADYTAVIQMFGAPADQKATALVNRGLTYAEQGDSEKELADYTAVIQMHDAPAKHKVKALTDRGWLQFVAGRYSEAIADQRQAISINSNDSRAHSNLAIALLLQGKAVDALAAYNEALDLGDLNDLNEMKTDLREAIEKHGQLPGAEEALARLEARYQALTQMSSDNNPGITPPESVGSK